LKKSNDLVDKNEIHRNLLNIVDRWLPTDHKQEIINDFFGTKGRPSQKNNTKWQSEDDESDESSEEETDSDQEDLDPRKCTGILKIDHEDESIEVS
jgi:hypothetical protein